MAGDGAITRLRQYLGELQPQTRAMLAAEIERAHARGDELLGASFLLEELRRGLRPADAPAAPRAGYPQRLFFAPLTPFLIDDTHGRKYLGRLSRTCLDPIWQWLCRDLVPNEAKAYADEATMLLASADQNGADQLARTFQDFVVERLREVLAAAKSDERTDRRLSAQIGMRKASDDLREMDAILRSRDALALIGSRLPPTIPALADDQLDNVRTLLDSPVGCHPDVFLHALLVVQSRLAAPWQLIRLAIHAAGSDTAARIAQTPFAVALDIVVGDIERMIATIRIALEAGRRSGLAPLVKDIHDAARALHTEIDLSADTPWARRLAAARGDAARLLQAEIEDIPGRVRRLLRPRAGFELTQALDEADVADTEAALDLFGACRTWAGELALSEATRRVQSELQNFFDSGMQMLLDGLRTTGAADRACRQSQVDAAVRFCGKLFGAEYAGLLAKAADVAAKGELKSARA